MLVDTGTSVNIIKDSLVKERDDLETVSNSSFSLLGVAEGEHTRKIKKKR